MGVLVLTGRMCSLSILVFRILLIEEISLKLENFNELKFTIWNKVLTQMAAQPAQENEHVMTVTCSVAALVALG